MHPDANSNDAGAAEKFQELQHAYEVRCAPLAGFSGDRVCEFALALALARADRGTDGAPDPADPVPVRLRRAWCRRQILSDQSKRARFDQFGHMDSSAGAGAGAGPGGPGGPGGSGTAGCWSVSGGDGRAHGLTRTARPVGVHARVLLARTLSVRAVTGGFGGFGGFGFGGGAENGAEFDPFEAFFGRGATNARGGSNVVVRCAAAARNRGRAQ